MVLGCGWDLKVKIALNDLFLEPDLDLHLHLAIPMVLGCEWDLNVKTAPEKKGGVEVPITNNLAEELYPSNASTEETYCVKIKMFEDTRQLRVIYTIISLQNVLENEITDNQINCMHMKFSLSILYS